MYYWRTFNQTERNGDDNINNGDDANQKILKRKTKGEGNFGILGIFDLLEKLRMVWNRFQWCSYSGKVEGDWIWVWPKRVKKKCLILLFLKSLTFSPTDLGPNRHCQNENPATHS